jgi:ferrous iron transport protein B
MSSHCSPSQTVEPATPPALTVALAGNPNAGKTSLFNRLTRLRAKVGNYPGVTVEKVTGRLRTPRGREVEVIDLPGSYSLAARSPEEQVALDVILGTVPGTRAPDVIVAVVDASNLERNLYMVEQMREMGVPMIVALNMVDVAERRRVRIAADVMSRMLGVPVVPTNARSGLGIDTLIQTFESIPVPDVRTKVKEPKADANLIAERYQRIEALCAEVVAREEANVETTSDKIDRVVTHRFAGPVVFLALMLVVFISIFSWATPAMDLIDAGIGLISAGVSAVLPAGIVRDLLVGGVIAGVGNVIIFLPQIVILFVFLAVLEDSGYMARAAFIMDRMMRGIGLSGRSFIPLLGSFACAIPGIMATRTIPSQRERLATILVAPFMSCSARLPVYALVTAAFFPNPIRAGIVVFSMYMLGIAAAVVTAFIIKRLVFRTRADPFLMELPPYRTPTLRNVWAMVRGRSAAFLRRAGTVILAITIVLWFLMNFPRNAEIEASFDTRIAAARAGGASEDALLQLALDQNSAMLRASYAGKLGHVIEPVVKPLGFDWKIGIGLIASFAAREVLVSTLGVVYSIDEEVAGETPGSVSEAMRADTWPDGSPIFTPLVGISILVFFVLAMQCMSTLAVAKRETNGWTWPMIMLVYMTGLAYLASLATYQVGRLLGFG